MIESTPLKNIRNGMNNMKVTVIIIDTGTPIKVGRNREVRILKVADGTARMNLSLWNGAGDHLKRGNILQMTKTFAKISKNRLTLYYQKGGGFDIVGDFTMLLTSKLDMSELIQDDVIDMFSEFW